MSESQLIEVTDLDRLDTPDSDACSAALLAALETGHVLYFSHLSFSLEALEYPLLNPVFAHPNYKNISLVPTTNVLHGACANAEMARTMVALIARYCTFAHALINRLAPTYHRYLKTESTTLRLHRVEARAASWRKDDSRLHIDAFPSRPNRGERILRVFVNLNPVGEPRIWRIGEPFEHVVRRFLPRLKLPWPGSAWLLSTLGMTKSRRSLYDHLMLGLHDAMKADGVYQRDCPQQTVAFAPGRPWVCFSDQTSHAAMSGQFMLEQSFFLPPSMMTQPLNAPLNILTRLMGRTLI